jgi:hypothetical protein
VVVVRGLTRGRLPVRAQPRGRDVRLAAARARERSLRQETTH